MRENRNFKISIVKGRPCVAHTTTMWSDPIMIVHHWPISEEWAETAKRHVGVEVFTNSLGGGVFTLRTEYERVRLRLADGGKTTPIKTDEFPVPPPKTKRKLRWEGEWQVFYKTMGWRKHPNQINQTKTKQGEQP